MEVSAMKLLTRELMDKLPPLYAQDGKGENATVFIKFFDPCGSWTWFATKGTAFMHDGSERPLKDVRDWQEVEDVRFFGLVGGFEEELGYFSLNELHAMRGPLGLGIERDKSFRPRKLREVRRAA
jgi:hypothetical protein